MVGLVGGNRRVAVGTICSNTLLCFLPQSRAASPAEGELTDIDSR